MYSCLIVDDEQHAIDTLAHHVERTSFLQLSTATTQASEVLQILNQQKIDIIFLDIQMPNINGLDLAETIAGHSQIIFVTAFEEYALKVFEVEAVDFILKPISYVRFLKAVQKAIKALQNRAKQQETKIVNDFIFVKAGARNKIERINFSDISFIEGEKNYVTIHHAGIKTLVYTQLKDLEEMLPENDFVRVHKSYIVSIAKVQRVEGTKLFLTGLSANAHISVGDSYKDQFWALLRNRTVGGL